MDELIFEKYIQYGFAGIAFILSGIIYYVFKLWRTDMKESQSDWKEVVQKNTEAFTSQQKSSESLETTIKENTEVLRHLNGKS